MLRVAEVSAFFAHAMRAHRPVATHTPLSTPVDALDRRLVPQSRSQEQQEEAQRQSAIITQLSQELAAMQELVLSCAESEDAAVM